MAQSATFMVTLRDVTGNPISDDGSTSHKDLLTITTTPTGALSSVEISMISTGDYSVKWLSRVPGKFDMSIKFGGTHIVDSPFEDIQVEASGQVNQPDKRYTSAEGQAIEVGAVAGRRTYFVLVPRSIGGRAVTDVSGRSNAKYVVRMGPSIAGFGGTSSSGVIECP
jgi:hypothetical protein